MKPERVARDDAVLCQGAKWEACFLSRSGPSPRDIFVCEIFCRGGAKVYRP